MLAATCMQIASFESAYPIMAAIRWTRQFHAMLATPLRIRDVIAGHQLYVASRVAFVSAVYLGIIAAFGAVKSPEALAAWPVAIILGLAFSAPVSAMGAWLQQRRGLQRALPLRHHADVPLLRDVLPGDAAAAGLP